MQLKLNSSKHKTSLYIEPSTNKKGVRQSDRTLKSQSEKPGNFESANSSYNQVWVFQCDTGFDLHFKLSERAIRDFCSMLARKKKPKQRRSEVAARQFVMDVRMSRPDIAMKAEPTRVGY